MAKRRLTLANAHLYFGDLRRDDEEAYVSDVLALGDFNLPKREEENPVYKALTRRGLTLPPHKTKVGGSNVQDDQHFDQMAVFPGPVASSIEELGVFDFDGAVFRDLWGPGKDEAKDFIKYLKYFLSDHRPLWASLRVSA